MTAYMGVKHSRNMDYNRRKVSALLHWGLLTALFQLAVLKDVQSMTSTPSTVSVIHAITEHPGLALERVDRVLGTRLIQVESESDQYSIIYKASKAKLAPLATEIELRSPGPLSQSNGFLILHFHSQCIEFKNVESQLPALKLIEVPRGKSKSETTGYSLENDWGVIRFGVDENSPSRCLMLLSFQARKPKT